MRQDPRDILLPLERLRQSLGTLRRQGHTTAAIKAALKSKATLLVFNRQEASRCIGEANSMLGRDHGLAHSGREGNYPMLDVATLDGAFTQFVGRDQPIVADLWTVVAALDKGLDVARKLGDHITILITEQRDLLRRLEGTKRAEEYQSARARRLEVFIKEMGRLARRRHNPEDAERGLTESESRAVSLEAIRVLALEATPADFGCRWRYFYDEELPGNYVFVLHLRGDGQGVRAAALKYLDDHPVDGIQELLDARVMEGGNSPMFGETRKLHIL